VRPEDYEAAAKTLPWVLAAGTSFRWTGSWLTVFTAVDPVGGGTVGNQDAVQLIQLLNRQRLAGYESYAPPSAHISIDLIITVCIMPTWLASDVESGILKALGTNTGTSSTAGFFFADRFTFGTPLFRSRLEATIQAVPGVQGVLSITYRERGASLDFIDLPPVFRVGTNQILRIENDPNFPERGTIQLIAVGGR
jgi:hypothetical protein